MIPGLWRPGAAIGAVVSLRSSGDAYSLSELGPHIAHFQKPVPGLERYWETGSATYETDETRRASIDAAATAVVVRAVMGEVAAAANAAVAQVRSGDASAPRNGWGPGVVVPDSLRPAAVDTPCVYLHCAHGLHRSGVVAASCIALHRIRSSSARVTRARLNAAADAALASFLESRGGVPDEHKVAPMQARVRDVVSLIHGAR